MTFGRLDPLTLGLKEPGSTLSYFRVRTIWPFNKWAQELYIPQIQSAFTCNLT